MNIIFSSYKFQTQLPQPWHSDTIISGMWWRDSTSRPRTTLTDSTPRNVYKVEECKAVLTIAFLEYYLTCGKVMERSTQNPLIFTQFCLNLLSQKNSYLKFTSYLNKYYISLFGFQIYLSDRYKHLLHSCVSRSLFLHTDLKINVMKQVKGFFTWWWFCNITNLLTAEALQTSVNYFTS